MILRKPYALLIKNFKKIHVVLCVLMAYLAYESNNILAFFNGYISTGTFTRTTFSLSSTYINIYMYIVAILIAAIVAAIYILMRQKKKPKLLYLILIIFYLGIMIYFFQVYNILDVIDVSSISPRSLRIIRDIASVICYTQYVIIIIIAIRAVGFNIKKFNFGEDLQELEIDVNDNEEFELTVGIDPNKIGMYFRRGRRELKYFIVENLFIISLITSVVLGSIGLIIFLNVEVYNKVYTQGYYFKANYFAAKVTNTYYTNLNQRGVKTSPSGKVFIVTEVEFANKDINAHDINLDSINITSPTNIYSPIITRYQSFIDLGTGYINQTVAASSTNKFIFVFEVNEDENFNKLIFRYRESIQFWATRLEAKYKRIRLKITKLNNVTEIANAKIGEKLSFKNSSLGNSTLKIVSAEIADRFTYDAVSCIESNCTTFKNTLTLEYISSQNSLLKLSYQYNLDSNVNVTNTKLLTSLIDSYGTLRYVINNKTYSIRLVNKTPSNYNGADLFYQVPSTIAAATKIELVITLRNKEYIYNLK